VESVQFLESSRDQSDIAETQCRAMSHPRSTTQCTSTPRAGHSGALVTNSAGSKPPPAQKARHCVSWSQRQEVLNGPAADATVGCDFRRCGQAFGAVSLMAAAATFWATRSGLREPDRDDIALLSRQPYERQLRQRGALALSQRSAAPRSSRWRRSSPCPPVDALSSSCSRHWTVGVTSLTTDAARASSARTGRWHCRCHRRPVRANGPERRVGLSGVRGFETGPSPAQRAR